MVPPHDDGRFAVGVRLPDGRLWSIAHPHRAEVEAWETAYDRAESRCPRPARAPMAQRSGQIATPTALRRGSAQS